MRRRFQLLVPALAVAALLAGLARGLDAGPAFGLTAETLRGLGVAYFALLAGAPLLLHPLAFRARAGPAARIAIPLLPAGLWWLTEVAFRLAGHPLAESVWLSLSPPVTALFQLLALEIGVLELAGRAWRRARRGAPWLRLRDALALVGVVLVVGNPLLSAVWFLPFSTGYHRLFQQGLLPEPAARPGPLPAGSVAPAPAPPPNLVVIYSDDHRHDASGHAGHPFIETPNLDRLAAEGVVFENAFVTSSLCSPSRASLLTGVDVRGHGVVNNFTPWSDENRTYFEYLAQRGYRNAFVGKWHMPGHLPELRGVEHFVTFTDFGGQGSYENGPLVVDGRPEPSRKRYMAEELTDRALAFLDAVGDAPFSLLISHKNVHAPFTPDRPERGRYARVPVTLPIGAHPWSHWTDAQYVHLTPFALDHAMRRYGEAVTSMDRQIGRVLDALDARGLGDRTLVLYTSDNGYLWGEHGLVDKRWAHEESIRVPFLLRPPGGRGAAPARSERLVLNLDVAPTLLDAAGIETPPQMQGRSVLPLLSDPAAPWRDAFAYAYWFEPPYPVPTQRALRSERWKYVEYDDRPPALYDLSEDPGEHRNLAPEAGPQLLAELRRKLDALSEDPRASVQARPGRPNLVLLILDTLRADALGAYGNPEPVSPEIDAYAERGVRFEQVLAQNTWTRPSIASMLTSLHPRTVGIYHEADQALAPEFQTLAETLQAAGYRTLGATANPNINAYFHFDQGFDRYFDSGAVYRFMPGFRLDETALPEAPALFAKLLAEVDADDARPVYLQLNQMEVHEAAGRCGDSPDPPPTRRCYLEALRGLSRAVGSFLDTLLAKPGFENTLVVITSDHGEAFRSDHPALADPRWHGHLVYPTHARVPWILFDSSGRLPAGRVVTQPVRLLELMPTLLDLADVPVPSGLAGRSLAPLLLEDRAVALPAAFVVESELRRARKIGVYQGEWLLVNNRDGHPGTNPVALQRADGPWNGAETDRSAAHAERTRALAEQLSRWEAAHPRREPFPPSGPVDAKTREQLRALGYLD